MPPAAHTDTPPCYGCILKHCTHTYQNIFHFPKEITATKEGNTDNIATAEWWQNRIHQKLTELGVKHTKIVCSNTVIPLLAS